MVIENSLCVTISMTSAEHPIAPTGVHPPEILPQVARPGITPQYSCAPPKAIRNPVFTSSKMSWIPSFLVTSRNFCKNSFPARNAPTPNTGSIMIPARSEAFSSMRSKAASCNGRIRIVSSFRRGCRLILEQGWGALRAPACRDRGLNSTWHNRASRDSHPRISRVFCAL